MKDQNILESVKIILTANKKLQSENVVLQEKVNVASVSLNEAKNATDKVIEINDKLSQARNSAIEKQAVIYKLLKQQADNINIIDVITLDKAKLVKECEDLQIKIEQLTL